jgi:hypothetical protein
MCLYAVHCVECVVPAIVVGWVRYEEVVNIPLFCHRASPTKRGFPPKFYLSLLTVFVMRPLDHLWWYGEDDLPDVDFWDVGNGTVSLFEVWDWSFRWEQSLQSVCGIFGTRERMRDSDVGFDVNNNRLLDAPGGMCLELTVYDIVQEHTLSGHPFIPWPHHVGGIYSMELLTSIISVYISPLL